MVAPYASFAAHFWPARLSASKLRATLPLWQGGFSPRHVPQSDSPFTEASAIFGVAVRVPDQSTREGASTTAAALDRDGRVDIYRIDDVKIDSNVTLL
jgi:hypothetical protein